MQAELPCGLPMSAFLCARVSNLWLIAGLLLEAGATRLCQC
jgi:hypothetical protein